MSGSYDAKVAAVLEGTTILNYQILDLLGSGAMGMVYKALDEKLDTYRAIKVIHPNLSDNPNAETRLMKEARAQSKLFHSNIATLLDLIHIDNQFILVMEYIDGPSLDQYLSVHSPSLKERLIILYQISCALSVAHNNGILHRDIKPRNVLVSSDGIAKVTDFGLAKTIGETSVSATGEMKGTAAYMAPEVYRGEGAVAATDMWAFGVLAYEVLTGHPPYEGDNFEAIGYQVLNADYTPLPAGMDEELPGISEFVDNCLQKDIKYRINNGKDAQKYLSQIATNAGVNIPLSVRPTAHIRSFRRKKIQKITTVVSLIVVLTVGWLLSQYAWNTHYQDIAPGIVTLLNEQSPSWNSTGDKVVLIRESNLHILDISDPNRQSIEPLLINPGIKLQEVSWSPNDSLLALVGSEGLYLFNLYSTETNAFIRVCDYQVTNPAWSSDSKYLVYCRIDQPIDILERLEIHYSERDMPSVTSPTSISISGFEYIGEPLYIRCPVYILDDSRIAFYVHQYGSHYGAHSVSVSGGEAIPLVRPQHYPSSLNWDASSQALIYFCGAEHEIVRQKVDNSGSRRGRWSSLGIHANISDFDFNSHMKRIVYLTANLSYNLYEIALNSEADSLRKIDTVFNSNYHPMLSSDGKELFYAAQTFESGMQLRSYNIDDEVDNDIQLLGVQLIQELGIDNLEYPTPDPTGRYIAFVGKYERKRNIWIYDRNEPSLYRLITSQNPLSCPTWSADGSYMYYIENSSTESDQYYSIKRVSLYQYEKLTAIDSDIEILYSMNAVISGIVPSIDDNKLVYEISYIGENSIDFLEIGDSLPFITIQGIRPTISLSRQDIYFLRDRQLCVIKNWDNATNQNDIIIAPLLELPNNTRPFYKRPPRRIQGLCIHCQS
ncbi:protein kinase [Gemmatimonadota bacterium]